MVYRIAISDDDMSYVDKIERYIKELCKKQGKEISVKVYSDSEELMNTIEKRIFYDLYLLDIEMPVYSGMDFLRELKNNRVETDVILLTSHIDYAVDAHEYSQVFRYIPKGKFAEKMEVALTGFFVKMDQRMGSRPYMIENRSKSVKIFQEEIVYIFKDRKYSVFMMVTGQRERERCGLQDIYNKLDNPDMIMLDRSFIINIRHVRRIYLNEIILEAGEPIYTSREHIEKLKKAFGQYWGELI